MYVSNWWSLCLHVSVSACPQGFYGLDCQEKCLCLNGGSCDHVSGVCSCPAGWIGPHCNLSEWQVHRQTLTVLTGEVWLFAAGHFCSSSSNKAVRTSFKCCLTVEQTLAWCESYLGKPIHTWESTNLMFPMLKPVLLTPDTGISTFDLQSSSGGNDIICLSSGSVPSWVLWRRL